IGASNLGRSAWDVPFAARGGFVCNTNEIEFETLSELPFELGQRRLYQLVEIRAMGRRTHVEEAHRAMRIRIVRIAGAPNPVVELVRHDRDSLGDADKAIGQRSSGRPKLVRLGGKSQSDGSEFIV